MTRACVLTIFLLSSLTLLSQQNEPKKDSTYFSANIENDPNIQRMLREHKFYDSLLSKVKFHTKLRTKLTNGRFRFKDGRFKSKDATFQFKADRGYVISNSSVITRPSGDPVDFIGGNIFQTQSGNHFVMILHYQYCVGESVHGCTNYSITFELPKLQTGDVINFSEQGAAANLVYWHFGSIGGSISSTSSSGEIKISKNEGGQVKGSLKCAFKNSDKTGFNISGLFTLPIVDRAVIDKFNQRNGK